METAIDISRHLQGVSMETSTLSKWDIGDHLNTEEDCALFLDACLEEACGDATFILQALGAIARAKGMPHLVREVGEGDPSFATILKVIGALGLRLRVEVAPARGAD
jgi:probable addiction module antidote protein